MLAPRCARSVAEGRSQKAWEPAQLQKFAAEHPISEVTGVASVVDTYRVVQRMAP